VSFARAGSSPAFGTKNRNFEIASNLIDLKILFVNRLRLISESGLNA